MALRILISSAFVMTPLPSCYRGEIGRLENICVGGAMTHLIKCHKGEFELVFLARSGVVGNRDEELKRSVGQKTGVSRMNRGTCGGINQSNTSTSSGDHIFNPTSRASICPVLS